MKVQGALGQLTKDSIVYGLGQAGGRVIQIFLVPILTQVFSPQEFGTVDLVTLVAAVATLLTVFGMDAALARFFYEAPDRETRRRMATTSALHRLAGSVVLGLALVVLATPISSLILASPSYAKYIRIVGFSLPFSSFYLFANEALRITFQPRKYIALNAINMALVGLLTIWFVTGLQRSVAGVFYAKALGDGAAAIAGLLLLRHTLTRRGGSWTEFRRMGGYGLPLVPMAAIYWVLTYADRQVLLRLGSLSDVGIYAVAVKVAAPVMLVATAFQLAWGPRAFAAAVEDPSGRVHSLVLSYYVAGGAAIALGVALFAPEILRVFRISPAYWGGAAAAGILAMATVAHGAYYIAAVGVHLKSKNYWLLLTTGVAALVTVVCAIAWVRPWGVTGVAWATLAGFSVSTTLIYLRAQRLHPFPYHGLACLLLFALAVIVATASGRMGAGAGSLGVRAMAWIGFAALGVWMVRKHQVQSSATELREAS